MRRLEGAKELLDGPLDGPTLRANLRDLALTNALLGGTDLSWRAVALVLKARSTRAIQQVLDVGTGGADIPIAIARRARDLGLNVHIVATDIRPEVIDVASRTAASAGVAGVTVRRADPSLTSEPDQSFDVVHSSLVLHHHEPDEARELLREMQRVSRYAVIVNDLDRRRAWWVGARLLSLLSRNPYTRHDAPLSVRRAYRPDELSELAGAVGLREVARYWSRPRYRYALVFVPDR